MGTRSRIGIEQPDGTIRSFYCHWDGYPEGVGAALLTGYGEREKVQELVALGDRSSLSADSLAPEETYKFKGEKDGVDGLTSNSRQEFLEINWNEEYHYLYSLEGIWLLSDNGGPLTKLTYAEANIKSPVLEQDTVDLLTSAMKKLDQVGLSEEERKILGL